MDDYRKESVDTEGSSEGQSSQQLSPYCLLTHHMEPFDGNHGRERDLERDRLLVDEQKGCIKGMRGTKDQLPVDKTVLKNCQRRLTNLSMAWIDYKKTFDMVPHSWVLKCLEMVGAAINMISLITNSMVSWRRGEVDIRKGIFLSPQYYVDNRLAN